MPGKYKTDQCLAALADGELKKEYDQIAGNWCLYYFFILE
jgi:hypothetical protein